MCARPLRVQYPYAFYHVMNRGNARQKIFNDSEDNKAFLKLLEESVEQWKIRIHSFSLMPNHYHMLIETPLANLSRGMRHINGVYTQRYNKRWKRDGHLFRGRYKAILVEDEAYLVELLRYIHLNPVDAGIVKSPEEYEWSSHSNYLGRQNLNWLTTTKLLSYFGKRKTKAMRRLHEFVMEGVPEKFNDLLNRKKWPSVFGAKHFQEWIEWNFVKELDTKEVQYEPQKQKALAVEDLRAIIVKVTGETWDKIKKAAGYETKRLRKIAIMGFHQYTSCSYGEICNIFGSINPSTVSRAVKNKSIMDDPLWDKLSHYYVHAHFAHCKT